MLMKKYAVVLILLLCSAASYAQDDDPFEEGGNEKFARLCMQHENFNDALLEYQELLKNDSSNSFYHHQIARCHLHLNNDKSRAIPILKRLTTQPAYYDPEVYYDLGAAYLATENIPRARKTLKTYLDSSATDTNRIPAHRLLQMCGNYDSLKNNPANVDIRNLGEEINSSYPDILPMIIHDESYLLFSSEREQSTGKYITTRGRYNSDLYSCKHYSGEWRKTRSASGPVNTRFSEYGVCMTSDAQTLLLVFDPERGNRFLLESSRSKTSWEKPDPYSQQTINKKENDISGAWITKDGKHLLISARITGGYGGTDLYISHMQPNQQWSEPKNLGKKVNTPYNETLPHLTPGEDHLVFASEGHNSMGGYDLMITPFSADLSHEWKTRNLGWPVNTTTDDFSISFTENMRYAYKSFLKPEGFGNLDIYRLTFKDTTARYVMLKGKIKIEQVYENWKQTIKSNRNKSWDSLMDRSPYQKLKIKARSAGSGQEVGKYRPDPIEGTYAIALKPGKYEIEFKYPGYDAEKLEIKLPDRSNKSYIIRENIHLQIKENL